MENDDSDISQVDPDSLMDIVRTHLRARYAGQVNTTDDTTPADDSPEESAALDGALHEAIERALAESVDGVFADLSERMPQMLAEHRADRVGFEARLYARWQPALDLFEAALVTAREAGADFNRQHRSRAAQENDYVAVRAW